MIEKRNNVLFKVNELTGAPIDEIMGRKRCERISTARQLTMWALVTLYGYSTTDVGILMRRNHATVTYAVSHINGGYLGKTIEGFRQKLIEYSHIKH